MKKKSANAPKAKQSPSHEPRLDGNGRGGGGPRSAPLECRAYERITSLQRRARSKGRCWETNKSRHDNLRVRPSARTVSSYKTAQLASRIGAHSPRRLLLDASSAVRMLSIVRIDRDGCISRAPGACTRASPPSHSTLYARTAPCPRICSPEGQAKAKERTKN